MKGRRAHYLAAAAPLVLVLAATSAGATDTLTSPQVSSLTVVAPQDDAYKVERTGTATRTDTPLANVPQSVTIITDEAIRDQSMRSIADVVRYVPGVTSGQGEGHRDAPTLRGNSTTADFFVDGVRDDVQYFRDLYNVERVEVLKGANAMIFGRGGGGGIINRVMKKANWATERQAAVELGSYSLRRFTADVGQPLAGGFSGRIVGVHENAESYRDFVEVERWGLNPSIGWRDDRLTVVASYEHFEDDRTVDRGIPSQAGRPSAARRSAFFGDPDQSFAATRVDLLNLAVEYQLTPDLVVRNRTLWGDYDKFYQNVYPSGAVGSNGMVNLAAYNSRSDRENLFNQTDLVLKADVAGLNHTLLMGAELGRQVSDNVRLTGFFNSTSLNMPVSLASPTRGGVPIAYRPNGSDANNHVVANAAALYMQDQVEITPELQLVLGLRYDSFDLDYRDNRSPARFSRKDKLWSPRFGLVYKPVGALSLYASYSVSYLPSSGEQFSSLTASTAGFEPEEFKNYEVGLKWQPSPVVILTAALYQLDRTNTTSPDPANPNRLLLTGEQRSQGFEASITGQVTSRWQVLGGYAYQEAEITRTTAAAPRGRQVPLVPEHSFSLWNKVELTPMFSVGLGVIHQTDVYTSISNAVKLPSFTRADAALFVRLQERLEAQLNVENVFDKDYFPTSHGDNNILPGAPRSVRVGLRTSF